MAGLAKHILVDRDDHGAPRITIDGQELPWYTSGIVTPPPSLEEMPTITVTFVAEKVEMRNDDRRLCSPLLPSQQALEQVREQASG